MILCWATFIAILGHMWPTGCELDTPGSLHFVSTSTPPLLTAVSLFIVSVPVILFCSLVNFVP